MRKLALALSLSLPLCLAGCGASVPQVVTIATIAVDGVCGGAAKLCEAQDPACGSSACHVFHDVCAALPIDAPVQLQCDPSAAPAAK